MQKALTPQHPSENNCFAGDAVKEAEETYIPLSSVSIGGRALCNLQFAGDIDLLGGSLVLGMTLNCPHRERFIYRILALMTSAVEAL